MDRNTSESADIENNNNPTRGDEEKNINGGSAGTDKQETNNNNGQLLQCGDDDNNNNANNSPHTVYTKAEKCFIVALASFAAMHSSISLPIYLPVIPVLTEEFHTTTERINLTVTMYSIFQGIGPSLWSPLADSLGRRPVYLACMVVYIGANIGLALAKNYAMLFVFRCLQSGGIGVTVAIGAGVVGDITTRRERGSYIGVWSGIGLVGNAFGPMIGGGISSSLGWRAIFWFLVITSGVCLAIFSVFMPETNRSLALNGSVIPNSFINRSPYIYARKRIMKEPATKMSEVDNPPQRNKVDLLRSVRMFRFIDVVILLVPAALHYTTWFMILTAQSSLLSSKYGFSTAQVGYSYLSSGIGGLLGSLTWGRVVTWHYKKALNKFTANNPDTTTEDFNFVRGRLDVSWYPSAGVIIGSIIFGWTIQMHVHYVVPLLATALVSFCSMSYQTTVNTVLVDLFPGQSSSSTGCFNLARCLVCAAGLAAVDSMLRAMGAGGTFTLMSGFCLLGWSLIYCELRIGMARYKGRQKKESL